MPTLDIKVIRDLTRLWAQVLAIALVIAGGVATLVLAMGSFRSLDETRIAYYERYRFADVFASVRRAPNSLIEQIATIPGVAAVEARIAKLALLDIPNFREPATGQFVSLPASGQPELNQLYMRIGRMPEAGSIDEVVVNEGFAKAHAFVPGSRFSAILNGRKRELVIVGIALSPEFVYAVGPGDRMPDDRRFGIIWMSERALASVYDLEGAFSFVSLKLLRDASEREVIARLDALLDPYGGQAAYGREDQPSHAFLEHGLDMLRNMSRTLPPIFLLVAAFLVNLTLTRVVALEREQVGLLKALGYRNFAIAFHYFKFVVVVAAIGILIGSTAGTWLGVVVTRMFGDYYQFPFLVFSQKPDVYLIGAAFTFVGAVVGAARALSEIVRLPPAVAMQPPAPPHFRRLVSSGFASRLGLTQPTMMMLRNVGRHPIRSTLTTIGLASATAILVVSVFANGAIEQLIDVTYFMADRQDAAISFIEKQSQDVVIQVARLPGILAVEPSREVPARIRYGGMERRVMISGLQRDADLSRVIDVDLRPVEMPEAGLAISSFLGQILGVRVGDSVEIDLLEGQRRTISLPVMALVEDYFGIRAMMDADALARLMREAPAVNGVNVSFDALESDRLYDAVNDMPIVSGMALQSMSLMNFREKIGVTLTMMASIYMGLAAIIAYGIVYNSARIALSERARELASLRVLGFTQAEVLRILLLELALLAIAAQPPGWALGYGLAWIMRNNLATEVMRVPMVVDNSTYALASGIVSVAAVLSALAVRRRVERLDLVSVLKTRD